MMLAATLLVLTLWLVFVRVVDPDGFWKGRRNSHDRSRYRFSDRNG